MVELSPFRTIADLRAPAAAMIGQLICPAGRRNDFASCDEHNWSGGWYITQTLLSVTHSWVGNAAFSSPLGGMLANSALRDISTPLP